jgi:hypothetical protein
MASMLGKAKKLKREGRFSVEEFKEVVLEESGSPSGPGGSCHIEIVWLQDRVIRFLKVDDLVDFLKKVA